MVRVLASQFVDYGLGDWRAQEIWLPARLGDDVGEGVDVVVFAGVGGEYARVCALLLDLRVVFADFFALGA